MTTKPTQEMSVDAKIRLLYSGAAVHLRKRVAELLVKSEAVTGELYDDTKRWEIESLLAEMRHYEFVLAMTEAILRSLE